MMDSSVLAVSFFMNLVAIVFSICAILLILIVLIQKGKGGGLSGAFGGGMASGLLGSKTGDFLTWITIVAAGVFLAMAIVIAKFYKPTISNYGEGIAPQTQQMPTQQQPTQQPPVQQLPAQEPPIQPQQQSSEPLSAPVETTGESSNVNPLNE